MARIDKKRNEFWNEYRNLQKGLNPVILEDILAHKKLEISQKKAQMAQGELEIQMVGLSPPKDFARAIKRQDKINLIAEIKKASPSAGVIRENFDPMHLAQIYQQSGAAALSVLTDEKFFQGHLDHIKQIKQTTTLPVLRKDFIIDSYQIYESRLAGADAILLIVAIISTGAGFTPVKPRLQEFLQIAQSINLDCLVEVHSQAELEIALEAGANIIGLNNRDLKTFQVDLSVTEKLAPLIPPDKIKVSESGITNREDVLRFESLGLDALLIGEALMRSRNIAVKIRELFAV